MKKIIFSISIITTVFVINIGCKKTSPIKETGAISSTLPTSTTSQSNRLFQARFQDNIKVSEYGFLILPTLGDLNNYHEYLLSHTHAQVQAYLDSLNFYSLGQHLYEPNEDIVTENEALNYVFNTNEIFQVEDVIMKPIVETTNEVKWQFLLTMTSSNLSNNSYRELTEGVYDDITMDKFATNPDTEDELLFEAISKTPTGYEETTANSITARRPMFGHGDWINTTCALEDPIDWIDQNGDGITDPTYARCRKRKTYIFWIGAGWDKDCWKAFGCQ